MLYRSKNDADNSVNDPIGGPDEINRKDNTGCFVAFSLNFIEQVNWEPIGEPRLVIGSDVCITE